MNQHASTARFTFGVTMPDWVAEEVAALGTAPSGDSPAARTVLMRLLNRLAERNVREGGGGPFAALVRDDVRYEPPSGGERSLFRPAPVSAAGDLALGVRFP